MTKILYQIIYTSQAIKTFTEKDYSNLVNRSQAYNFKHGITGMIILEKGKFTQVLEGELDDVEKLMFKILQDPRHSEVKIIRKIQIESRFYSNWMMGFRSESIYNLIRMA